MVDTTEDPIEELDASSLKDVETSTLRKALNADDNQTRISAAKTCSSRAEKDIDNIVPLIPDIVDRLDDERVAVLRESTIALACLAESQPESLEGSVGPLVDLLVHNVPIVRATAAKAIGSLAIERPEWFVPHVEGLLDVIGEEIVDPTERIEGRPLEGPHLWEAKQSISTIEMRRQLAAISIAANVLVEISDTNADALEAYLPRIVASLDHDVGAVVAASADILANISQEGPDVVSLALEPLCSLLNSQNGMIRARVVRALGILGDENAIEPLRRVATDEGASQELRDLAIDTILWLEQP